MDLNEQNNKGIWRKVVKVTSRVMVITLIIIPCNNVYASLNTAKLEENKVVISDKLLNKESEENNKLNATYVFNSNNIFNINLKGHLINLVDNTIGLTELVENKYSLLEEICNSYINELDININNITSIEVNGTINSDIEKNRLANLKLSGDVAKEVYGASVINESLSDLEFKIDLTESEFIEPETVMEECSDLYIGSTETVQGVRGINLVHKEIVYDGLNKGTENIVRIENIEPVVNTVLKVGTKNPYYDGIAFLSNPSKGGYLSSYFGEVRAKSVHKGIDIAKNLGDSVNAALGGTVINAGYNNGGYGNLIIIQHGNNMKTYYAHLSEIYVNVGDVVNQDDIIGAIGSTGNSTGPHLHFELRVDNQPVDPIKYIKE